MDASSLADRAWPLLGRVIQGHVLIYRATHGVIGHRIPGGAPMLLLDHVGAKSGTLRTTPLVYGRDGQNIVLVASKGGHPNIPAGTTTCWPIRTPRSRSAPPARRCARVSPRAMSASGCGS